MAKRIAQKNKQISTTKPALSSKIKNLSGFQSLKNLDAKEVKSSVKDFITAPSTLYVAGGIGAALLARFAFKYYKAHPEITQKVKNNIDSVENKLKEYRSSLASTESSNLEDATH